MTTQITLPVPDSEHSVVGCLTVNYTPDENVRTRALTCPRDAVEFLHQIWNPAIAIQESFYVVLLDNSKTPLGYTLISIGGATATIVDPVAVLRFALVAPTSTLLLAHNHPSGNMKHSGADQRLTSRICEGAKLLGMDVADHIILSGIDTAKYLSFREEGLLP